MKKFVGKKWEYDDYGDIYTHIDNNRKNIACTWHLDYSPEELQANTRLIAAAPEMYATLERWLDYIGALSKKTEYGFLDKLEKDINELLVRIDGTGELKMTEKLKPCPLCGSEAKIKMLQFDNDVKQVFCPNCGAKNSFSKDAIERWNNRKKDNIQNCKKDEIKRCPICGSLALECEPYKDFWFVRCLNRLCYFGTPDKPTREEAIELWNRRINNE